jgi:hypothetical protein
MCDICDDLENQSVIDEVKAKVTSLCLKHPVYKPAWDDGSAGAKLGKLFLCLGRCLKIPGI